LRRPWEIRCFFVPSALNPRRLRLSRAFAAKGALWDMVMLGGILLGLGLLAWLGGELRLLVLARRRSLAWFLGCLFVPMVAWLFFLLNTREAWKPVVLAIVGMILTGVGCGLGGQMDARTLLVALCEAAGLFLIWRLWRRRNTSLAFRILWSLVLLIPAFGIVFYGLLLSDPAEDPGRGAENAHACGEDGTNHPP
jgi:hypothetical protein